MKAVRILFIGANIPRLEEIRTELNKFVVETNSVLEWDIFQTEREFYNGIGSIIGFLDCVLIDGTIVNSNGGQSKSNHIASELRNARSFEKPIIAVSEDGLANSALRQSGATHFALRGSPEEIARILLSEQQEG